MDISLPNSGLNPLLLLTRQNARLSYARSPHSIVQQEHTNPFLAPYRMIVSRTPYYHASADRKNDQNSSIPLKQGPYRTYPIVLYCVACTEI